MKTPLLAHWHEFSESFAKLAKKILQSSSININAKHLRDEVKLVARNYIHEARPLLERPGFEKDLALLDDHFKRLHELADGMNKAASYQWRVSSLRKAIPKLTTRLEMEFASTPSEAEQSFVEKQILKIVSDLVPTAGLSYSQALRDLAASDRVSYRGPAAELRETLREVLDHLAPDGAVAGAEGFKYEKDRSKPTMKQKVRFIMKARGQGSSASELSERAAEAVDSIVGNLTRSVYNYGSVVTHVAGERQSVVQLKRYVDAVLSDLLEL